MTNGKSLMKSALVWLVLLAPIGVLGLATMAAPWAIKVAILVWLAMGAIYRPLHSGSHIEAMSHLMGGPLSLMLAWWDWRKKPIPAPVKVKTNPQGWDYID